jgi:hypothetical protein
MQRIPSGIALRRDDPKESSAFAFCAAIPQGHQVRGLAVFVFLAFWGRFRAISPKTAKAANGGSGGGWAIFRQFPSP